MIRYTGLALALLGASLASNAAAKDWAFRTQEVSRSLTVGYAVRLLDMNGDGKLDIFVVDAHRLLWFENPTWTEHVILQGQTRADNVCVAPLDIDGDGRLDFAIGADWRPGQDADGAIQWLHQGADGKTWTLHDIHHESYTHRMQWADLDGKGRPSLLVVPLMGKAKDQATRLATPIRVFALDIPADPKKDRWPIRVLNDKLTVAHNFDPVDFDQDGRLDVLVASFEGVTLLSRQADRWQSTRLGTGNQATKPNRGSSEIKLGSRANGRYIATIEPWHGHQVVVYTSPITTGQLWERTVIDEQLQWGHAVWPANLDDDADQELIIGVRDNKDAQNRSGVRIYDPAGPKAWSATRLDPGGVAVEDLIAGDLNADGRADIVAVGRATKNVRIYWNETVGGDK